MNIDRIWMILWGILSVASLIDGAIKDDWALIIVGLMCFIICNTYEILSKLEQRR